MNSSGLAFSDNFFTQNAEWFHVVTESKGTFITPNEKKVDLHPLRKAFISQKLQTFKTPQQLYQSDTGTKLSRQIQRYGDVLFLRNLSKLWKLVQKDKKDMPSIFPFLYLIEEKSPINKIPEELTLKILTLCEAENLFSISRVCHLWNRLTHEYPLAGKKCEEIIKCSIETEMDINDFDWNYLQIFQRFVHKLDLSAMPCDALQMRLLDTISLIFENLHELRIPKYSLSELNDIYTFERRKVTRKQIKRLIHCHKLDVLVFDYCDIDINIFDLLKKMKSLKKLSLYQTPLDKQNFEDLSSSESLKMLMLSHTSINLVEAKALSKIKKLKKLCLYHCEVSPEANSIISGMTHLTHIIVNDTSLDLLKNLIIFREFKNLKHLVVTVESDCNKNIIEVLIELPNLRYFESTSFLITIQKVEQLQDEYRERHGKELKIEALFDEGDELAE